MGFFEMKWKWAGSGSAGNVCKSSTLIWWAEKVCMQNLYVFTKVWRRAYLRWTASCCPSPTERRRSSERRSGRGPETSNVKRRTVDVFESTSAPRWSTATRWSRTCCARRSGCRGCAWQTGRRSGVRVTDLNLYFSVFLWQNMLEICFSLTVGQNKLECLSTAVWFVIRGY